MKAISSFRLSILLVVISAIPAFVGAHPGEIIKSFDLPGKFCTGLAFDGQNLWVADRKTDLFYCLSATDGKVIRTLPSPGYWPLAMTWDGTTFWTSDLKGGKDASEDYDGIIYQVDPVDGTILHTLAAPSKSPTGLAWDGQYLWCADDISAELIQFSPKDGTTIRSFRAPVPDPSGLAFDGRYLWVCDRARDEIYMISPENGTVILILDAPGPYTMGLCYDGKNLWNMDYQEDKLFQLTIMDDETYIRKNERTGSVTFTHQVKNFGPGKVTEADLHIAIPVNRANQELIGDITYNIQPSDFITDQWGQKTAHYHFENIAAGETKTVEMTTRARTWEVRHFIFPEKVGGLDQVPADIREKYLENNEKFQYDHPVIQDALRNSVGNETNPYWMVRNIFDHIIQNMYYEMTGGWNTAPTVLARGNGSCSEYTFVFIAMCRAAGIPARYVGSVVVRGDDSSMDDVFHRWAEVYLPGYGWIPVDGSRGDRDWPRDQAIAIGTVSGTLLITTQSGGGSETLGWTYNSNQFWKTEPKTYVNFENFADWE